MIHTQRNPKIVRQLVFLDFGCVVHLDVVHLACMSCSVVQEQHRECVPPIPLACLVELRMQRIERKHFDFLALVPCPNLSDMLRHLDHVGNYGFVKSVENSQPTSNYFLSGKRNYVVWHSTA